MVLFLNLLGRFPLPLLHLLGAGLGLLTYVSSARYRHHLQSNLSQAGLPQTLRFKVARETGKQMLEMFHIWCRPLEKVLPLVKEIEGLNLVESAREAGKGVVYLTPHLGCFEMTAQYLSSLDDITVLYRPPKFSALQTLIIQGRKREKLHLAPADLSGVRALIKALKRGQAVGLLPDQAPKQGEGSWLDFFGKTAYTMTLGARLTETGAAVLMVWGERLPNGQGFKLHFSELTAPLTGDTVARAQQINREIEHLILKCPTQYLWGYNRYKRPSSLKVVDKD